MPVAVGQFGDSVELADELIALVVDGPKRATAGALADYEHEGAAPPRAGDLWIAADGSGRPRALLRTAEVRIGPLSSVDDAFAWDEGEGEGEGDRTRASWLDDHERFFRRYLPTIGERFDTDMPTVFERFEVLYTDPGLTEVRAVPNRGRVRCSGSRRQTRVRPRAARPDGVLRAALNVAGSGARHRWCETGGCDGSVSQPVPKSIAGSRPVARRVRACRR